MKSRVDFLKDLVLLRNNIESLEKDLYLFAWDSEMPFYPISIEDFTCVLKRGINDEIDFETLIRWANALECRDDLEFNNEAMQEFVFELPNPEINGKITKERLQEVVYKLQE
ncbi:hypothetical protein [Emticicia sp. 21SJ11W-3]|uniref:hypothetical protein n=1 Tax=Emticicia sp. 21SJ11W-3 TaxID=2916755 RepID=UPI00209E63B8|nr:hypothetical protein [Emticicia sp. 21SJ11W-3]UTA66456.1 hypothetical protein MB380_12690 [Emticicia sp. 21SJ11W-3]